MFTRVVRCTAGQHTGPVTFSVYINDLSSAISLSNVFIFAMTQSVLNLSKLKQVCKIFQKDLLSLSSWSSTNHLSFSTPKLMFMCYHGKFISEYSIDGNIIPCSSSCKDLGIHFSDVLCWWQHYQCITSKTYKTLGLLRRIFKDNICTETRKSLYISIVISKLLYCSHLWKPYLLSDIDLVEKVQRRATNTSYKIISMSTNNDLFNSGSFLSCTYVTSSEKRGLIADPNNVHLESCNLICEFGSKLKLGISIPLKYDYCLV